jgi:hypothetical protein
MAADSMPRGEGQRRLLHQIERGRELLRGDRISDGDFNAWSTSAEDVLTRLNTDGSVALRGFKSAVVPRTAQEMKDL